MPALRNARQEKFAQQRFAGAGVWEAYRAAGYTGNTKAAAALVSQLAQVKERIAELNGNADARAARTTGFHPS